MRAQEVVALGDLAGEAATSIAGQARDVHGAVADRVFATLAGLGVRAAPVRVAHDAFARSSYAASGAIAGAVVRATGAAVALTRPPQACPLGTSPRGRVVLGALGGAWGDRLAARDSVLATPLSLIVDDRRSPSRRLAVFVHGLGETELAWRRPGYGDRLAAGHGITPVYARYNSGRAIAENGAALAGALAALVADWPVAVDEITLVGHSMGGLVVRAACHHGRGEAWCDRVRRTVGLGTPHEGAPLARAAASAERALSALPETRPFAAPLRARSAGVRDLEHGLRLPWLAGADHLFVSASVTNDPRHPAGWVLGDLLVHRESAWGRRSATERLQFGPDRYRHLGGVTHFDLLGHPAVVELLGDWIAGDGNRRRALAAPLIPAPAPPALIAQRP